MVDNLTDIGLLNLSKVLKDIRQKNFNKYWIAQVNINVLRDKFALLSSMISDNVYILIVSETKTDSSFFTA